MKIIGAGFGRTGTSSLKLALEHLGYGPVLHASCFTADNIKLQMPWFQKVNGSRVPWPALLDGYSSALDWPVAYYWRQLAVEYPDAKFILTHRPVREWVASFKATILPNILTHENSPHLNRGWAWRIIGLLTFNAKNIGGELDFSDDNLMRCYARHIAEVRAEIEPGRLLEFSIREGWGPLCRFLDVPVPQLPFPRENDSTGFIEKATEVTDWLKQARQA